MLPLDGFRVPRVIYGVLLAGPEPPQMIPAAFGSLLDTNTMHYHHARPDS